MKAISLWQPWASAIALGLKRYETRSWSTDYRGPLAIHASKRFVGAFMDDLSVLDHDAYAKFGEWVAVPLGCVVATCTLVAVHRTDDLLKLSQREYLFGDFSKGRFALELADIKPLVKLVPAVGRQGFFNVEVV